MKKLLAVYTLKTPDLKNNSKLQKKQFYSINMVMTTKEKVLQQLKNAGRSSVSGEELASVCGVSRAAIWKAVNSLRAQGCTIEGTTNGGYILGNSDIFSAEIFEETFFSKFPQFKDCHTECFKEIDSTNTYAKRKLAECGNLRSFDGSLTDTGKKYHQSVIIAESQTAGRGRLGRTFVSPDKTGIYITLIYAPEGGITNPARLTACTAVAICRAIKALYNENNIEPKIKWINDIFLNGKKICGILAEGVANFESGLIESAVVGIGINLKKNKDAFNGELEKVVGALENDDENHNISRASLAAEIVGQVLNIFEEDKKSHEKIMEEYRSASFLLGQQITVFPLIGDIKTSYKATATSIDDNAGLIVTLSDGSTKTLNSGEVSLKSSLIS